MAREGLLRGGFCCGRRGGVAGALLCFALMWGQGAAVTPEQARGRTVADALLYPRFQCIPIQSIETTLCSCAGTGNVVQQTTLPNPVPGGAATVTANRCVLNSGICNVPTACMTAYLTQWATQAGANCPIDAVNNYCCAFATYAGCADPNALCGNICGPTAAAACVTAVNALTTAQTNTCNGAAVNPDTNQQCDGQFTSCAEARACLAPEWNCLANSASVCTTTDLQALCRLEERPLQVAVTPAVCAATTTAGCENVRAGDVVVGEVLNLNRDDSDDFPWYLLALAALVALLTLLLSSVCSGFLFARRKVFIRRKVQIPRERPQPVPSPAPSCCPAPCCGCGPSCAPGCGCRIPGCPCQPVPLHSQYFVKEPCGNVISSPVECGVPCSPCPCPTQAAPFGTGCLSPCPISLGSPGPIVSPVRPGPIGSPLRIPL